MNDKGVYRVAPGFSRSAKYRKESEISRVVLQQGSSENDGGSNVYYRSEFKW